MKKKLDLIKKKSSIIKNKNFLSKKSSFKKSEPKIEKILIENFVSLQKVMTNLSIKFDDLTNQISKLLNLFEISAKALAKKDYPGKDNKEDGQIIKKIDNLLDQNKIIARGLTLLHEPESAPQIQRPSPPATQRQPMNTEEYQKSISSRGPLRSSISQNQKFGQLDEE